MQLTLFTDYTLRTLIYLGARPEQVIPSSVIAAAYGISSDHIAKAAKWLTQRGYLQAVRGRAGGIQLLREPKQIQLGKLIRETEPDFALVECFDGRANTCPITAACRLKGALARARDAFLAVLDEYTLADLLQNRQTLLTLLPPQGQRGA